MFPRKRAAIVLVAALAGAGCRAGAEKTPPPAPSVFVLVRHAEKAGLEDESPLTDEGTARAERLARLLRDAGIERIFSTDFARTRLTAAPLAAELGLEVELYDPHRLEDLATTLRASPTRAFVVGHKDTTPELVSILGGEAGPAIGDDEHDRVYLLHYRPGVGTTTVVLRSGP